jgi:Ser/Thr protein kinase RdoA (MazF antagonist)
MSKDFIGRCTVSREKASVATQLAQQALNLYHLPRNSSVRLVNISENVTYRVEAPTGRRWALRLQRPGYQTENSLASEIAWLVALRRDGVVATPVPVIGLDGEYVQTVRLPDREARNVVLFEWENGCHPEMDMDLRHCFKSLGTITAQMHLHSTRWHRPDEFERFTWNFETALGEEAPRWGRWRDGLGMNAPRLDLFGRTAQLIRQRLKD